MYLKNAFLLISNFYPRPSMAALLTLNFYLLTCSVRVMHAFIFAGGFATRLWPLTEARAKPLLPLAGKPILTHLLEKLPQSLSVKVSTNVMFAEGFRVWQQQQKRHNLHLMIEDSKHDGEKLGALGALRTWLEESAIEDDLLLLTGDNYFGFSLENFLMHFDGTSSLIAAHDIGEVSKASSFGTVLTKESTGEIRTVTGFEEKPLQPKTL